MRARPCGDRERRLLGAGEPDARPEDVVAAEHDATEELLVDEPHRLGGREGRPILLGEREAGAAVVLAGTRAFERHQATESVGAMAGQYVRFAAVEAVEVLA